MAITHESTTVTCEAATTREALSDTSNSLTATQKTAIADDEKADADCYSFDTLALHAGTDPDPVTGAVLTPIYQTTAYV